MVFKSIYPCKIDFYDQIIVKLIILCKLVLRKKTVPDGGDRLITLKWAFNNWMVY
jgi:hypothetical protein